MTKSQTIKVERVIVIQPALPNYRFDFFERLYSHYGAAFQILHAKENLSGLTDMSDPRWAGRTGAIVRLPLGLEWQGEVAFLQLRRDDIIVLCGNPRQLSTIILLLRARLHGAQSIWWGHLWSSTSKPWRQKLRFIPMRLARGLLFYTDAEIDRLFIAPPFNLKRRTVAALNNGIDTRPVEAHRSAYEAASRERALLFIGRLTKKAQLELVLQALANLGTDAVDLHVIGSGEEGNDLRQLAQDLGIEEKVIWHGAIVDEARIAEIANQCRAFVYPGAVGLSLIHSMAYGLPSVVHDDPRHHMPEIAAFEPNRTGMSFVRNDSEDLTRTIAELIDAHVRLNAMSAECVMQTRESFNTHDMARRFIGFIDAVRRRRP